MSKKSNQRSVTLVSPSSTILNKSAEAVFLEALSTSGVQKLIDTMLCIAQGQQGDTKQRTTVGLAAPQVGVAKRIIIVDIASMSVNVSEVPDLQVYINPRIVQHSTQKEVGREGCFSTGNVCGIVERYSGIIIEAYSRNGEPIREDWSGFIARIFQHEIDHLDGIRFPERVTDDRRLHWVKPELFGEYRTHWAEWAERRPRSKWERIRAGRA